MLNVMKVNLNSKIAFGNNKSPGIESGNYVGSQKSDSVTINHKAEPPKLTTLQIIFNQFTDEQIAQINKSRRLPKNAHFLFVDGPKAIGLSDHKYDQPYYIISLSNPNITRALPEGYEVKRAPLGGVKAVKIEEIELNNSTEQSKQYPATINNKLKPPELTNLQVYLNNFTDEQIAQINKSRMLPENACFVLVDRAKENYGRMSGHKFDQPYYRIELYTEPDEIRILPDGYEVQKTALNGAKAVKIKEN